MPQSRSWLRGRRAGGAGGSAEWKTSSTCRSGFCPGAASQPGAAHVHWIVKVLWCPGEARRSSTSVPVGFVIRLNTAELRETGCKCVQPPRDGQQPVIILNGWKKLDVDTFFYISSLMESGLNDVLWTWNLFFYQLFNSHTRDESKEQSNTTVMFRGRFSIMCSDLLVSVVPLAVFAFCSSVAF